MTTRNILSAVFQALFIFLFVSPVFSKIPSSDAGNVRKHQMDISVDIQGRSISGKDTLTIKQAPDSLKLYIRLGSDVERIESGGAPVEFVKKELPADRAREITVTLPKESQKGERTVTVFFKGTFQSVEKAKEGIKRGVAYVDDGVIGEEGVFLPSNALWYPQEETGLPDFDVTVSSPKGYVSITEGEWVKTTREGDRAADRWKTDKPVEGLDLVIAKYMIEKETYKGIDIYTFFFNRDDELTKTYINKTKGYLDLYQDLIGPYPFKKFAVVENFLPTGYGMPSFTLLGSTVIRLPFIPDTSLGHEIAHNWWGNSVFVDSSQGNWSEAITTYTADYLYEKKKGPADAEDFRLSKLRGYRNFAATSRIALKDFIDSTGTASRAVGYNKGDMVFNMLELTLGEDAFKKGLKEFYRSFAFKKASWADIEASFEKASNRDLSWFFSQWLTRSGGPMLSIEEPKYEKDEKGYTVSFKIRQHGEPYILDLPVLFETEKGKVWKTVNVSKETDTVYAELASRPLSFEVDPEYQVFRILADDEMPPSFGAFFGDKRGIMILPNRPKLQDKYFTAATTLAKDYGLTVITDSDMGKKDFLKDKSLFIFGGPGENILYAMMKDYFGKEIKVTDTDYIIDGKTFKKEGTAVAVAIKNPHAPAKMICVFMGDMEKENIEETAKRMRYFSDLSYIVFPKEGKPVKGTFPGKKVLRHEWVRQP